MTNKHIAWIVVMLLLASSAFAVLTTTTQGSATTGASTSPVRTDDVLGCTADSNCKLIYSSCDCEAVPITDKRTSLDDERICIANSCLATGTIAVCNKDGECEKTVPTTTNTSGDDRKYCNYDTECVREPSCCDCGIGNWINKKYYQEVQCTTSCKCAIAFAVGVCEDHQCVGREKPTGTNNDDTSDNEPETDRDDETANPQGQDVQEVEQDRKREFREIIAVLGEGKSYVNGTQNYTQDDINAYIKALNEQTKNMKEEIKNKIQENDTDVAEQVVKREMARRFEEKAQSLQMTASDVLKAIESASSSNDQASIGVLSGIDASMAKRMYVIMQEGQDEDRASLTEQIDAYIFMIKKNLRPKVVIDTKSLASTDLSPEQILDQIYSTQ